MHWNGDYPKGSRTSTPKSSGYLASSSCEIIKKLEISTMDCILSYGEFSEDDLLKHYHCTKNYFFH